MGWARTRWTPDPLVRPPERSVYAGGSAWKTWLTIIARMNVVGSLVLLFQQADGARVLVRTLTGALPKV